MFRFRVRFLRDRDGCAEVTAAGQAYVPPAFRRRVCGLAQLPAAAGACVRLELNKSEHQAALVRVPLDFRARYRALQAPVFVVLVDGLCRRLPAAQPLVTDAQPGSRLYLAAEPRSRSEAACEKGTETSSWFSSTAAFCRCIHWFAVSASLSASHCSSDSTGSTIDSLTRSSK